MAVTTDPYIAADLAGFIGEVWPGMIQEEMVAKAVAANFFWDLSDYAKGGGDYIHIPDIFTNAFTAVAQSTQGAEITTAGPAQVDTTLNIASHYYVAYIIGDLQMAQLMKSYDFNSVYTKKSAGTLRTVLEAAILGLWSSATTYSVTDTATVLNDSEIRIGIESLEAANFDTLDGETAFFVHPYTFYIQLGAVARYYDQATRGPLSAAGFASTGIMSGANNGTAGLKGVLYGVPVYVTSHVGTSLLSYRNILAKKDAFAFATQTLNLPGSKTEGGRVRAQSNYELRNLGYLTVVDMIYGVACLRAAAAVVLNGSTAFIGS
jgi:hypothetical protein